MKVTSGSKFVLIVDIPVAACRLTLYVINNSRQLWSAYAVHMTTLSPPALLGDLALIFLCHKATASWDEHSHALAMSLLAVWMFVSKFIKLLGHYIRFPIDWVFLPVSILFGYFHGAIKMYAVMTLSAVRGNLVFLIVFSFPVLVMYCLGYWKWFPSAYTVAPCYFSCPFDANFTPYVLLMGLFALIPLTLACIDIHNVLWRLAMRTKYLYSADCSLFAL